jgi:hypothetical protein
MALTARQRAELFEALLSAFPRRADFKRLLYLRLGRSLDEFPGSSTKELVLAVIQSAEAEGWIGALVESARTENPGNALLQALDVTS